MGAYYPRIAYCDQDLLIDQGWQGCFDKLSAFLG